jgi:hypothetical protein
MLKCLDLTNIFRTKSCIEYPSFFDIEKLRKLSQIPTRQFSIISDNLVIICFITIL